MGLDPLANTRAYLFGSGNSAAHMGKGKFLIVANLKQSILNHALDAC